MLKKLPFPSLLCIALLLLPPAIRGATVQLNSAIPVRVAKLTTGTPVNYNRPYSFAKIPDLLMGLHYVAPGHRKNGPLQVKVVEGGELYLLLWVKTPPEKFKLSRKLEPIEKIPIEGISDNPFFQIFQITVAAGENFTIASPDRWGAIVAAGEIQGLGPIQNLLPSPPDSRLTEFQLLQRQIHRHHKRSPSLKNILRQQALRPEALIADDDQVPSTVVLRRTRALALHLRKRFPDLDLSAEFSALDKMEQNGGVSEEERFSKACKLRKKIAFRNPQLQSVGKILFLKRHRQARGMRHMITQYCGFNNKPGGSVFVLDSPFAGKGEIRDLLAGRKVARGRLVGRELSDKGSFLSLELDYEARNLLFAWTEAEYGAPPDATHHNQHTTAEEWKAVPKTYPQVHFRPETTFHIFSTPLGGDSIHQLTDGPWNEFDPCVLPNGRIVFVSERLGSGIRCGNRPLASTTLHAMMPDGSDLLAFSRHDTNEWHPSIDNDGMLVYTRWDYVDRDSDVAHHLWRSFPDGRDPRSLHGNYPKIRETRPWMEMNIRAIPNSRRFVATATPHHGQAYGSLVIIDERREDDGAMSQLRRLTPEFHFPEAEKEPGVPHPKERGRNNPQGEYFATAWPLDEDFYLCAFSPTQKRHGICYLDSFGNIIPLHYDPQISCIDPIPLRPRPRPPVIPVRTTQAQVDREPSTTAKATLFIANVYDSTLPWNREVKLRELRIINVFPKTNARLDHPFIGTAAQSLARGVLGTVPIEKDGSVYCEIPTDVGLYFQVVDDEGLAVQTMRSITYAHRGENLTCVGCHENKRKAPSLPKTGTPLALLRSPSIIKPEPSGSYPLTFPRLVQPVIDRNCLACHQSRKSAPSLSGTEFGKRGWSRAALTLSRHAWGKAGGNGGGLRYNKTTYSLPGQVGARASKLYNMLANGHHQVKLSAEDLRRLTLWLDANSCFYGAYHSAEKQAKGEIAIPQCSYLPEWER